MPLIDLMFDTDKNGPEECVKHLLDSIIEYIEVELKGGSLLSEPEEVQKKEELLSKFKEYKNKIKNIKVAVTHLDPEAFPMLSKLLGEQ